MSPEYQLAADLTKVRGDHLAQISQLEKEIKELRYVHRVSCEGPCKVRAMR